MANAQPSLDEMISQYQSKQTASKPASVDNSGSAPLIPAVSVNKAPANQPSLDEMISNYQSKSSQPTGNAGQLPSISDYAKSKYDSLSNALSDNTDAAANAARQADTSPFHFKSTFQDLIPGAQRDISKLTALGTGAIQGVANAGHAIAEAPNAAINAFNKFSNLNVPNIPVPSAQFPQSQYQQEAVASHPNYESFGEFGGNVAATLPLTGEMALGKAPSILRSMGVGAGTGALYTDSTDPYARLGGAALGTVAGAIPTISGKSAQNIMTQYTGKNIDKEASDAFNRLGIQDKVPAVFHTTDSDAQKELVNDVAPAFGNAKVREGLTDLANTMDQKTNDLVKGFDLKDATGKPIVSAEGELPSMGDVSKNIEDKINAKYSDIVSTHKKGYEDLNNKAREMGVTSKAPNYTDELKNVANWKASEHDIVGGPSKEVKATAKEMLDNINSLGKPLSFEGITKAVPKLNELIRDSYDSPAEKAFYTKLRDAAEKDIDEAVDNSGHPELRTQLSQNKKYFKDNVVPFFDKSNPTNLSRYVGPNAKPHENILQDLVAQGKKGNASALSKTLSLVPEIKDDLGYLQLNSAGSQLGKETRPDVKNALQSVTGMHKDTASALFSPDKLQQIRDLRTATAKLDPLLSYGANPATGARVQQSTARKIFNAATSNPAQAGAYTAALISGHALPAAAAYGAQVAGKIGLNKMKATLMTNPNAFKSANAQTLLSPAAKKAYRSLMAGTSAEISSKLSETKDKEK